MLTIHCKVITGMYRYFPEKIAWLTIMLYAWDKIQEIWIKN